MDDDDYFALVTEPGDERSRQMRHAMESGLATPVTWVGMSGEAVTTWGKVVECRPKHFEGEVLEEWILDVVREGPRPEAREGGMKISLDLSSFEDARDESAKCPHCGGKIVDVGQCPHCGAQIPVRGLGGVFLSDTGEESTGPPLHDGCTCETRLFFFDGGYWIKWETPVMAECSRCIAFDTKLRGWEDENFSSE